MGALLARLMSEHELAGCLRDVYLYLPCFVLESARQTKRHRTIEKTGLLHSSLSVIIRHPTSACRPVKCLPGLTVQPCLSVCLSLLQPSFIHINTFGGEKLKQKKHFRYNNYNTAYNNNISAIIVTMTRSVLSSVAI